MHSYPTTNSNGRIRGRSIIAALAFLTLACAYPVRADFSSGPTSSGTSSGTSSSGNRQAEIQRQQEEEARQNRIVLSDFDALERSARTRLAQLISDGAKPGDIISASEVLRNVCQSRQLSVSSRLSEPAAETLEGFKPQISALPDAVKKYVPMLLKADATIPPAASAAVKRFLDARDRTEAKDALNDVLRIVPAMEARDKAISQAQQPSTGKTPEEQKSIEEARVRAGNTAFDTAWQATKKAEQIMASGPATAGLPK